MIRKTAKKKLAYAFNKLLSSSTFNVSYMSIFYYK